MVNRPFWQTLVEQQWSRRSVLWLRGVRRAGKTCLAQSLREIEYFDCERPRVRWPREIWYNEPPSLKGTKPRRVDHLNPN